jgi:hypothetical protein
VEPELDGLCQRYEIYNNTLIVPEVCGWDDESALCITIEFNSSDIRGVGNLHRLPSVPIHWNPLSVMFANIGGYSGSQASQAFKVADEKILDLLPMDYQVLDENGNRRGVPVNVSGFPSKPTLVFLQSRFTANAVLRQQHKQRVKGAVDRALSGAVSGNLSGLEAALEKQGIRTVLRRNQDGVVYGITYVDHLTKCVFNGSALGKAYGAEGILERCGQKTETVPDSIAGRQHSQHDGRQAAVRPNHPGHDGAEMQPGAIAGEKGLGNPLAAGVLETLPRPEQTGGYVPGELKKRRRKKKKKGVSKQP